HNHHTINEERFQEHDIEARICTSFVPAKPDKPVDGTSLCYCNRSKRDHPPGNTLQKKWDINVHTTPFASKEHGKFANGAWYLRCDLHTDPKNLEKILFDVWGITEPRLIMSIIGGAKYFKLTERLETKFINGIITVALKSQAWLLTNGFNVGITQFVGQAINKSRLARVDDKIIAIGLPKYGCIKNINELEKHQPIDAEVCA
ncbi:unnamed protein product, partial [Didymodactylos carnosus]